MPINREILTKNLINIRKQHKLTQTDIASQLGITQQAYAKWESGDVIPDILLLDKLADIYQCPVTDLIKNYDKEKEIIDNTNKNLKKIYHHNKFVGLDFSSMKITHVFKHNYIVNCNFKETEFLASGFNGCQVTKLTNLENTKFNSSVIKHCNFNWANFKNSNFHLVNLKTSNFKNVDFSGSVINESYLYRSNLIKSQFNDVKLDKFVLKSSNSSQCEFKNTVFSNSEIIESNFRKTNFTNCVFRETFFKSCHLRGATFTKCKFDRISYNFAKANHAKIDENSIVK